MRPINYKNFVKSDSFIGKYLELMEIQETPVAYDFWCALWLMSLAVGRSIYVDRPRAPVYLNWYTILVADSGVTRKSTAIRTAYDLLRKFEDKSERAHVIIQSRTTPEDLEYKAADHSAEYGYTPVAICVSELVTVLGRERYTIAMPGLLTDWYDCPSLRRGGTRSYGSVEIRDLFPIFLAASTPAWLAKSVNPNVVEGGFTSRCVFVCSSKRKRKIAWPVERAEQEAANYENWLVEQMLAMEKRAEELGKMQLTEEALVAFSRWYSKRSESQDAYSSSFESREDAHVLRMAAFLAIDDGLWKIGVVHIRHAIAIIDQVKRDGAALFEASILDHELTHCVEIIRRMLIASSRDGIKHSKLYNHVRRKITVDRFQVIMDIMHEMKLIQKFEIKPEGRGRPMILYRGVDAIAAVGALDDVFERLNEIYG